MKIEAPNDNKIIVELSLDDMVSLDITYEEMDYSNIETRRVIWTILDKARIELGKDIDPSEKMIIETLPKGNGGCIILFTVTGAKGKQKIPPAKVQREHMVYEFENADNLIDLYQYIKMYCDYPFDCELYSKDGKYRVITMLGSELSDTKTPLNEYGRFCGVGNITIAQTKEHWKKEASSLFS